MKLRISGKNWLEWTVFAISLLLVLAVVGLLVRQAVHDENRPPDLVVSLGAPQKSSQGFIVPLTVTNLGDQTAQAVSVEVRAQSPLDESSELQFDFVASREKREGWAAFSGSATDAVLSARVKGYIVK